MLDSNALQLEMRRLFSFLCRGIYLPVLDAGFVDDSTRCALTLAHCVSMLSTVDLCSRGPDPCSSDGGGGSG